MNTLSIGNEALWEAQNKVTRVYAQSGQYHTIVESRVHLTWYQSHALNLAMLIGYSNVEQRTPKRKRSRASIKGEAYFLRRDK